MIANGTRPSGHENWLGNLRSAAGADGALVIAVTLDDGGRYTAEIDALLSRRRAMWSMKNPLCNMPPLYS